MSEEPLKAGAEHEPAGRRVRYAVVGLGHIAQAAVLPAFAHAHENSTLAALLSDDPAKRRALSRRYGVQAYPYEDYESCLKSGKVDAVYLCLPNSLHREYAVRAARAGVHVLCEKPMALTERECSEMIGAAREARVRLMVAYRLHFEPATLDALELVRSGKLGEARLFSSVFTMQAKPGNIRLDARLGGGPVWDIGVYCVNAARMLFQSEPVEVSAFAAGRGRPRFRHVNETLSAVLRFPDDRVATFVCSFGASDVSQYRLVGTKGDLRAEPAYEYAEGLSWCVTIEGKSSERTFRQSDQFAPELLYFSRCVLEGREPEPSGEEGLADVRVIRALLDSARSGRAVKLAPFRKARRPRRAQRLRKPPVSMPRLVRAEAGSV